MAWTNQELFVSRQKRRRGMQILDDERKLSHFNSSLISSLLVAAFKGQIFFDPRLLWKLDRGSAEYSSNGVFLKSILTNYFYVSSIPQKYFYQLFHSCKLYSEVKSPFISNCAINWFYLFVQNPSHNILEIQMFREIW